MHGQTESFVSHVSKVVVLHYTNVHFIQGLRGGGGEGEVKGYAFSRVVEVERRN